MKKNFKLVLALVVALMMVLSSVAMADAPTFGAEAPVATDTTLNIDAVDGHTYTGYQLFTGVLGEDGKTLSNVKWGANAASTINYKTKDDSGKYTVDASVTATVGGNVPYEVLDYLASLQDKADDANGAADATAAIIKGMITGDGFAVTSSNTTVKTGYYVVMDAYTDASADQTTTLSTYICEVVGPTTLAPKAGTTTHKKEVADNNDSQTVIDTTNLKNINDWDHSADYDFNDYVPFKLTTTIASDYAKYETYVLKVHDEMCAALELDENSIIVTVDGKDATKGSGDGQYTVEKNANGFTVAFADLTKNTNAGAGKDVVVYYRAKLLDTAKVGNPGNLNESYAEYSNNPNDDQTGNPTSKTPKDKAVVFTLKTVVNKVDQDNQPLNGAAFTLYKKNKNGQYEEYKVLTSAEGTTFNFKGLDDGEYKIVETRTPDGYNTIDDIVFTLTVNHTSDGITDINGKTETETLNLGEFTATVITSNAGVETSVVNQKGATLPSTGGIGTTIFYVAGSIMVLAAAILLVTKRRMGAND